MPIADDLRHTRIALNNGSGAIPALGFGTLIPDPAQTRNATKVALEAGFNAVVETGVPGFIPGRKG
jgi:diketogulonate reductase-like aldo/keto reductase